MPHRAAVLHALSAIGLLVVLVMSAAVAPAGAEPPAWNTYNHDGFRTAVDPDSGSPVSPVAAWSAQSQLDGSVWAQPLVVGSRVYVATENDTIYALDAATGRVIWQRSVGTAVPAGKLGCGDISPTVGITSTPVIDGATGRIYAVANTITGGVIQHRLVALTLSSGDPVAGFPVPVDPPHDAPADLLQRASLALSGERVIVPYGGNAGDCGSYHGWLVSAAQNSPASQTSFEVAPGANEHGGAIWGSGGAPAVDSAGHVFVSTGNGFSAPSNTVSDLQESVVELDPSLNVIAHWTPSNWKSLDASDTDLGSSEPLPLPGGLLFEAGKDGVGRLLSATALGTAGQLFSAAACNSGGVFGSALYRDGVIYLPCSGGLAALRLVSSPSPSFTVLPGWNPPGAASGPPMFAGGLVWSTGWRTSKILYGLDPATGAVRSQTTIGTFNHFASPSAGGGRLFVAATSNLAALRISDFPPGTSAALTTSSNPSRAGVSVMLNASVSPAPDGGSVSFTDAGRALPGCGAVALAPRAGAAACRTNLPAGAHELRADYSGDAYFGASTSAPLRQVVLTHLSITAPRVRPRRSTARQGSILELTLSEAAKLRVTLTRVRSGRKVHGRCRLGARTGTRCSVSSRARIEGFTGKRGANRLRLNLRRLPTGQYVASLVALDRVGVSATRTIRFVIAGPRR